MQPLVSVIIPFFNSEKYLEKAVSSVLNQTYKNIEVILVDDGSSDGSLALANKLQNGQVKVFHQSNRGAASARNKGLAEAKGEYIQYLDADDLLDANKIELQVDLLQKNPGCICTCPTAYFQDGGDFSDQKPPEHWISEGAADPVDFLIKLYGGDLIGPQYGGMIALHSWLCPRAVLDKAGEWNEDLSVDDDGEYFCRVMLASAGIAHSDETICYYRKYANPKSLSSRRNEKAYQSIIKSIDLKFGHMVKTGAPEAILNRVFARLYNEAAVVTYPRCKTLSAYANEKSKKLGPVPSQYKAGPLSTFLSKFLGWRLMRRLDYYRHGK